VVSDMRDGSIQWFSCKYRNISNWNARRIRPLTQGTFPHSSRREIYWPKNITVAAAGAGRGTAADAYFL
jgi:hypothetical protein